MAIYPMTADERREALQRRAACKALVAHAVAVKVFAAAMASFLSPPPRKWFTLDV